MRLRLLELTYTQTLLPSFLPSFLAAGAEVELLVVSNKACETAALASSPHPQGSDGGIVLCGGEGGRKICPDLPNGKSVMGRHSAFLDPGLTFHESGR
jgi:hypothetical protein